MKAAALARARAAIHASGLVRHLAQVIRKYPANGTEAIQRKPSAIATDRTRACGSPCVATVHRRGNSAKTSWRLAKAARARPIQRRKRSLFGCGVAGVFWSAA